MSLMQASFNCITVSFLLPPEVGRPGWYNSGDFQLG
jgi:hypothetical protein